MTFQPCGLQLRGDFEHIKVCQSSEEYLQHCDKERGSNGTSDQRLARPDPRAERAFGKGIEVTSLMAYKHKLVTHDNTSGSNEEAEKQLLALQSLRQSDWEEKQRLSQLLEEERQRNMTAVAADMMTKIKEQKRLSIQRINALTSEKTTLSKRFKDSKEDNAKLTIGAPPTILSIDICLETNIRCMVMPL